MPEPEPSPPLALGLPWPALLGRIARFAVVSGLGWVLDFAVFAGLVHCAAPPLAANAAGAALAVTWVYWASVRRIFLYGGPDVRRRFVFYALYQVFGIALASIAVDALVRHAGVAPLPAKILVTPVTFLANYLFMSWLTRPGRSDP